MTSQWWRFVRATVGVAVLMAGVGIATPSAVGAGDAPLLPDDGPFVAQPGKDAPYVPTPQSVVNAMLKIASVGPKDFVIDLGSGDGRIVLTAVRDFGAARAVGVELDSALIDRSRRNAAAAGFAERASFRQENIFETDLGGATVVTMYLMPEANMQLRPRMLQLPPGTRVVSHAFHMEDWEADEMTVVTEDDGGGAVRMWIVPADTRGRWSGRIGKDASAKSVRLDLTQTFQEVTGELTMAGVGMPIREGRLQGDRISFTVEEKPGQPLRFEGQVRGNAVEGRMRRGNVETEWQAIRTGASPHG